MHNLKLKVAYAGGRFLGWQKTPIGPSIEETLEAALTQVLQHGVTLQAASRTDAGVHAEGQIVNFFTAHHPKNLQKSINALLPDDMHVLSLDEAPLSFHPTQDNIGKEYTYQICSSPVQLPFHRHFSWHFPTALDLEEMKRAAVHVTGTHDFSTFCNERHLWTRNTVCTLYEIRIEPLGNERFEIQIRGDHFLYKMVRNIVGTLVYVGCGKIRASAMPSILQSLDRRRAGVTAPAHGLSLKRVLF